MRRDRDGGLSKQTDDRKRARGKSLDEIRDKSKLETRASESRLSGTSERERVSRVRPGIFFATIAISRSTSEIRKKLR